LAKGWQPLTAQGRHRQLYREALEHIASIAEVRVLTVGLPTKRPLEAYRLWFWLLYAVLVERKRPPRPRLPLTVIDGEDASFRSAHDLIAYRFYRSFPRIQPYVKVGPAWFVGGAVHQDSKLHPFVQMADLVAGAGRHAIAKRAPYTAWYGTHLRVRAKSLGRGRDIDLSAHALARLKALSPNDTIGSRWQSAQVPP
jgi:hypothetical protein